jgi:putative peptidoglycan lipid II flippase
MQEDKSSYFKIAAWLAVLSLIAKVLGFAREQAIAWRFGASAGVDSYVAALAIPQLLAGLLGGAIAVSFLPVYTAERTQGKGRGLSVTVALILMVASLLATVATVVYADYVVSVLVGSFPLEQQAQTVILLRVLAVGTFFMSLTFFLTMLQNAHKEFTYPALSPVIQNAVIVAGLVWLGVKSIEGLAWLTILAASLPFLLLLLIGLRRGLPLLGRPSFSDPALARVLRLGMPILVSSLFGQLYTIVDRRLASGLDTGSLAALNFSNKLVQLPIGLFVTALATAIYPALSEHAAKADFKRFGETVLSSMRVLIILLIPSSVAFFVLRYPLVRLAFERGSFDTTATSMTSFALGFYAIGLLGAAAAQVLARAFYSLQDTLTPVKTGIATALVNTLLALVLVRPLAHGGLALANSIGFLFNAGVLFYVLRRRLGSASLPVAKLTLQVLALSLLMGLAMILPVNLLSGRGQLLMLGTAGAAGGIVYGTGLLFLRVPEVDRILKVVMERVRGR